MSKTKILLVLSNSKFRDELIHQLEQNGFEAISVSDGFPAIEMVRRIKFKAVITQTELPSLDVLELILNLRDFDKIVPVIVLTQTEFVMKREIIQAGADVIEKFPVTANLILKFIRQFELNQKKSRHSAAFSEYYQFDQNEFKIG
ncbi:MAG: response regulator [bacterium]|nr:response regulator [bacterium]